MNIINIMNFIRTKEPRNLDDEKKLFKTTELQLELVRKHGIPATYLFEYDALCDSRFVNLFKENDGDDIELGIWYEIVKPMTDAVGMKWRGREGMDWDWHAVPTFSMSYTKKEREQLADETMRKFREVFGYYPRVFGTWIMDSYTMEYLAENYDIDAFCLCRDQTNTDAETQLGGYFNNPYYACKKNSLCPAQTKEEQIDVPVLRLLGSCPIHCYDGGKYAKTVNHGCFTLEPVWVLGRRPEAVDWMFDTYFKNGNIGLQYIHTGQENSFVYDQIIEPLDMQLEKINRLDNVKIMKMGETGKYIKENYPMTAPSSVFARNDWTGEDLQSSYYSCKNYMSDLFYREGKIYLRALYKFDENFADRYLDTPNDNWTVTYENLPVVDTAVWGENTDDCGLFINGAKGHFDCSSDGDTLVASAEGCEIRFSENKIVFSGCSLSLRLGDCIPEIKFGNDAIDYTFLGYKYRVPVDGIIKETDGGADILPKEDGKITFYMANNK
ncbi:MAG: hypothetical protein K6F09_06140 [Clostridiales bacterium]|nr:hypothetical protein [Clostridiales bacterium]